MNFKVTAVHDIKIAKYVLISLFSLFRRIKMISSPFCAVSVLNVCEPHTKECESMLLVKKYVPYLRDLLNSSSKASLIFTVVKLFHEVI